MPRVGLVRYATVAHSVAAAVLPRYARPRSKHTYTQPQLLAVLLLMRYDGWTFRDAEVRLAEHAELRRALGFQGARVPDYTTLWRFLDRLDLAVLDQVLAEVDRRLGPPRGPGGGARALTLALDATGLATASLSTFSLSTFFVRREYEIRGQVRERAYWLRWLVVADVDRQLILAQTAHGGPTNDSRQLPRLCAAARAHTAAAIGRGGPPRTRYRGTMVRAFPKRASRRRVLVEALFSAAKRTQGGLAPARSERRQIKQAHLLGASFNVARLRPAA